MKSIVAALIIIVNSLASCSKTIGVTAENITTKGEITIAKPIDYIEYIIAKGAQYCNKNTFVGIKYKQLSFNVQFDSSAIYHTAVAANQDDINKLFGFSDNNALHHEYSARFGWRWSDSALHLFGYIYNKGVMSFRELGTVEIGEENHCTIKADNNKYVFTLNGKETVMPRLSTTTLAEGYKLYPYFGGDESAPHTIKILIKEF